MRLRSTEKRVAIGNKIRLRKVWMKQQCTFYFLNLNLMPFSVWYHFYIYYHQWDKICTPHLKGKKLSNNSTWDFEHIFDIRDPFGLGPGQNFVHSSFVFSVAQSIWVLSNKKRFKVPCGIIWQFFSVQKRSDEYLAILYILQFSQNP